MILNLCFRAPAFSQTRPVPVFFFFFFLLKFHFRFPELGVADDLVGVSIHVKVMKAVCDGFFCFVLFFLSNWTSRKKKISSYFKSGASQPNIYASSRNWISHSSAVSLPQQSGVLSWKQTGSSSHSTLGRYGPSVEKPNKTGFYWNTGSPPGVGRLSLKGYEQLSDRWSFWKPECTWR